MNTVALFYPGFLSLFYFNFMFVVFQVPICTTFTEIIWNMIVVTVFLLIMNQTGDRLAPNRKENCHNDHIPFNSKGI